MRFQIAQTEKVSWQPTRRLALGAGLLATAALLSVGASPASAAWSDNFDSYDTVTRLPDQSTWEAWDNDPNAGWFYATAAQSRSAPNSVEIDGTDDAVHQFSGHNSGQWDFRAWLFVPQGSGYVQYFILLNTYPAASGESHKWSVQLELDPVNAVVTDFNGGNSLPMVFGQWAEIWVSIDLISDTQVVFYNGNHLVTKSWTAGVAPGGALNIAAVDLWANGAQDAMYYDDMSLARANAGFPSFSVDFQGPMMGIPDVCMGVPITEGDILIPPPPFLPMPGPLPPPCTAIFGGPGAPGPDLGLAAWAGAVGHPAGVPGFVEVDALSYGTDWNMDFEVPFMWIPMWSFSVDEFAWGGPGGPMPSVFTEGVMGAMEASADIYVDFPPAGPGPFPPPPPGIFTNLGVFDGDGLMPFGAPGLGLIEPNPPTPQLVPDPGDNLDALDIDHIIGPPPQTPFPVYFSLDSPWPDLLETWPPCNSGSAMFHGFVGGDVLVTPAPGAPPMIYAPSFLLGLDQFGPDSDDLDALILWENGDMVYQPSLEPFDWLFGGTDMLLFSVRRGSMVIGTPDSLWGAPIEEGDILCPPFVGGVSPFPGIFIPAEQLGLATLRSGMGGPFGFADDLDAADVTLDCNMNLIPDAYDIATGTSQDVNNNGIPDECEPSPCPEDVNGDGVVDVLDLLAVIAAWGNPGGPEDVNGDGIVDVLDLLAVISAWGPC